MVVSDNEVIDSYFAAMRKGAEAEDELVALFEDDAVYDEPFTHQPPAVGREAIRERLRLGWETPLPELELDVLEVEVDGGVGRALWECRSPALPKPMRGEDRYQIANGRISRLEVRLLGESER